MNVYIVKGYVQYDGECTIGVCFDESSARDLLRMAIEQRLKGQDEYDCEIWDTSGLLGHFEDGQSISYVG